jgi:uncharacterized cupin superfamily protein
VGFERLEAVRMTEARIEGVLLVEGEERRLEAWDFVHCPPGTAHTIVATGDEPGLVFAVGARVEKGSARYPIDATAIRFGAGRLDEGETPEEAYGRFGEPEPAPAPNIF